MSNVTAIDLSFARDEELSPEKLSAFERALDNSYGLYRTGLLVNNKMFEGAPNKHIKVSLATGLHTMHCSRFAAKVKSKCKELAKAAGEVW